jgi:hypothetical protein
MDFGFARSHGDFSREGRAYTYQASAGLGRARNGFVRNHPAVSRSGSARARSEETHAPRTHSKRYLAAKAS